MFEMCAAKNGVSAMELSRKLGITYKSAWHLGHRIRYALTRSPLLEKLGGVVEVDETYIGGRAKNMHASKRREAISGRGGKDKTPVITVIERGGEARSQVIRDVNSTTIREPMRATIDTQAVLNTDMSPIYSQVAGAFRAHHQVDHVKHEYVNGDAHTNSVEGYFGQLKPSIRGTYRHVSQKHLDRYLNLITDTRRGRIRTGSERLRRLSRQRGGD